MARTTSTQRGASRRTTRTASSGKGARGASTSRSRKPASKARVRTPALSIPRPAGPWVPISICALVVVLAWSLYPAARLQYQASRRMAGLEQQYDSLKARNDALRKQVADLKTPEGVEKAAREDLGYAKAGENVYVVMPSGQATATKGTSTASVTDTAVPSILQVVLDALFGVEQPTTATVEP